MRLNGITDLLAVAAIAMAVGVYAYSSQHNIHPPLRQPTNPVPYEPDRIIRMTLHEYKRDSEVEHKTTGRFVTFGIPMKYLATNSIYPDQVPLQFMMEVGWRKNADGRLESVNLRDGRGLIPRDLRTDDKIIRTNVTFFKSNSTALRSQEFQRAKASAAPFPGYGIGMTWGKGATYWLGETYCGFDVFESIAYRPWHLGAGDFGTPPPSGLDEPFNRARLFGLPDGAGGYRLAIECKDTKVPDTRPPRLYCNTDAAFNDYIVATVRFQHTRVCDAEEIVDAQVELLRQSVVEER